MLPKMLSPTFTGNSEENKAPFFRVTHHDFTLQPSPDDAGTTTSSEQNVSQRQACNDHRETRTGILKNRLDDIKVNRWEWGHLGDPVDVLQACNTIAVRDPKQRLPTHTEVRPRGHGPVNR